ncbi:hypothetical protein GCM10027059_50250 [Myceligenerans halotolerans]
MAAEEKSETWAWTATWVLLLGVVLVLGAVHVVMTARERSLGADAERMMLQEYPEALAVSEPHRIEDGVFRIDVVSGGRLLKCVVNLPEQRLDCFER